MKTSNGCTKVGFGRRLIQRALFVVTTIGVLCQPQLWQLSNGWYRALPSPATGRSIYVPGAGFSGFWYHLGFLQSLPSHVLHNYEYYCYSSGCLSVLLALMNQTSVDRVLTTCFDIQSQWLDGHLSRYDMVHVFLQELVVDSLQQEYDNVDGFKTKRIGQRRKVHNQTDLALSEIVDFASHLHVLVSSWKHGAVSMTPSSIDDLFELLLQTTWIPWFTGDGWFFSRRQRQPLIQSNDENEDHSSGLAVNCTTRCYEQSSTVEGGKNYEHRNVRLDLQLLDGGFSRMLHPPCYHDLFVPMNIYTLIHTFNPGLDRSTAMYFWEMGRQAASHHHILRSAAYRFSTMQ